VYRSEPIVDELIKRIITEVGKISDQFEIILVEDGSPDDSWSKIEENCKRHPEVKGVKLSRNFGQHYAITAGLQAATGDLVVIMDCDLQDDPAFIAQLVAAADEGNEIVFTKRIKRKHTLLKSLNAKIYNFLFGLFSERSYDVDAGSLVLFTSKVKEHFLALQDRDRLYLQLLKWIGFKHTYVPVEHRERFAGKSSYNFPKLMKMALQGWTSHSDKLLRFSIYGGFLLSLVTFILGIVIIIRYFLHGFQPGWPSLFVGLLFSTGLILMSIGITGIYIGKIFEQVKNRPLYIVEKKLNIR